MHYTRCPNCYLYQPLCFCAELNRVTASIDFTLVIHRNEYKKSSNSARLALQSLTGTRELIFGLDRENESWQRELAERPALILFPMMNEEIATQAEFQTHLWQQGGARPRLIVPDGNWAQAKNIARKIHRQFGYPFVTLPPRLTAPSRYQLRSHPDPAYLSTFEAIASVVELVDGPQLADALMKNFLTFVERSLLVRGLVAVADLRYTSAELGRAAQVALSACTTDRVPLLDRQRPEEWPKMDHN